MCDGPTPSLLKLLAQSVAKNFELFERDRIVGIRVECRSNCSEKLLRDVLSRLDTRKEKLNIFSQRQKLSSLNHAIAVRVILFK